MTPSKTWLQRKLDEACGCHSGRAYRSCCLRREAVYFIIGALAALALFGAHDSGLIAIIPIIVVAALAGWLVTRHYRRLRQKDATDNSDVA
jgi:hypothetical protein